MANGTFDFKVLDKDYNFYAPTVGVIGPVVMNDTKLFVHYDYAHQSRWLLETQLVASFDVMTTAGGPITLRYPQVLPKDIEREVAQLVKSLKLMSFRWTRVQVAKLIVDRLYNSNAMTQLVENHRDKVAGERLRFLRTRDMHLREVETVIVEDAGQTPGIYRVFDA